MFAVVICILEWENPEYAMFIYAPRATRLDGFFYIQRCIGVYDNVRLIIIDRPSVFYTGTEFCRVIECDKYNENCKYITNDSYKCTHISIIDENPWHANEYMLYCDVGW